MITEEPNDNIKVLVIDDSELELKLYFNGLTKHFDMSFAPSAKEGWDLLNRAPLPDCIILDIMMPNEDGLQLCSRLKENQFTKDIPIIFISALTGPTIKSQAFELGGSDFVTKPPMITELVARIKRHVALYKRTKKLESLIFIDPLTHLPNTAKFHEVLSKEWSRCARYWHHMSLLLIEIDDLEKIKDDHGDEAYDSVVASVADSLSNVGSRPGDLLATLDNDVFALLLPDCSHTGALQKAKQIIAMFDPSRTTNTTFVPRLTCTIGLSVAAPAGGGSPEMLYKAADDLLFEAQQRGRGRIYEANKVIGFEESAQNKGETDK